MRGAATTFEAVPLIRRFARRSHWHHAVLSESRGPRINLNFRYIPTSIDDTDIEGQKTYYKYMVFGDHEQEWVDGELKSWSYKELEKEKVRRGESGDE